MDFDFFVCCLRRESCGHQTSSTCRRWNLMSCMSLKHLCFPALSTIIRGSGAERWDDGTQRLYRENVSSLSLRSVFLTLLCIPTVWTGSFDCLIVSSSITNLKYWGQCEPITSKTLQLLNDLSLGYPYRVCGSVCLWESWPGINWQNHWTSRMAEGQN